VEAFDFIWSHPAYCYRYSPIYNSLSQFSKECLDWESFAQPHTSDIDLHSTIL
jgi:hypothetical protein